MYDIEIGSRLLSDTPERVDDFRAYCERSHRYRASDDTRTFALEKAYWSLHGALEFQASEDDSRQRIVDLEMHLLAVLSRMEAYGVAFDRGKLRQIGSEIRERVRTLETEIFELVGEQFNINSTKQLQHILYDRLGFPASKKTKTGRSVDTEVLSELSKHYAVVGLILEHRTLRKLLTTYVEGLDKSVNPKTTRIHTTYRQLGAATGRMSSESPNLQNIPAWDELSDRIKSCFIASGHDRRIMVADYSQVELRLLANLSEDEALCRAFEGGEDIHMRTAKLLFWEHITITPDMRRMAKGVNFGVIYGITGYGLSKMTGTTPAEASRSIETFYARYPRVREYYDALLENARRTGYVATVFGRRRYLPTIRDANRMIRERTEREAINMPIQGSNADIIKYAMVELSSQFHEHGIDARMIMQVHDELVFDVASQAVERTAVIVRDVMEGVYRARIPLIVEIGIGEDWHAAKA